MATCRRCGIKFDPIEAEELYDGDPYVRNNGLDGSYSNFSGYCSECALDLAAEAYPQGQEDLSYRWGDDS